MIEGYDFGLIARAAGGRDEETKSSSLAANIKKVSEQKAARANQIRTLIVGISK